MIIGQIENVRLFWQVPHGRPYFCCNAVDPPDGALAIDGVPYRYTKEEVVLLNGMRNGSISTREIQFVVDQDRARKRKRIQ